MVQTVEIAIDTMDAERIRPFWKAMLGYRERNDELIDPRGTGPTMRFQQMDEPRTDRDRLHLDVIVPHDEADARVAAALAAGGRLVSDAFARSWWILARRRRQRGLRLHLGGPGAEAPADPGCSALVRGGLLFDQREEVAEGEVVVGGVERFGIGHHGADVVDGAGVARRRVGGDRQVDLTVLRLGAVRGCSGPG